MTIQEGKFQEPMTSSLPRMNVQQELQKGITQNDKNLATAENSSKLAMAGVVNIQPTQNPQQVASAQISKGYLDIKI